MYHENDSNGSSGLVGIAYVNPLLEMPDARLALSPSRDQLVKSYRHPAKLLCIKTA